MENDLPKRESIRLKGFDYNKRRAYFITICTEKRRELLSRIVGGDVLDAPYSVELLPHGKVADRYINQMNEFYNNIKVDRFVIMPDHIHIMLFVLGDDDSSNGESQNSLENGASRTSPPTKQHSIVSRFVSTLKRFCNKEYGENIWQRYFNDHIIRNREDYEKHIRYIYENPKRWYFDNRDESLWEV